MAAVSTHSRLKAAGTLVFESREQLVVSTHSRLKAAGNVAAWVSSKFGFNTQPPEGGWPRCPNANAVSDCFNTQPPEGGWARITISPPSKAVSTHSRLKAAGFSPTS